MRDFGYSVLTVLTGIGVVVLLYAISFIPAWLLVFVGAKIFGYAFSWWYVVGVWLILCILKSIFGGSGRD